MSEKDEQGSGGECAKNDFRELQAHLDKFVADQRRANPHAGIYGGGCPNCGYCPHCGRGARPFFTGPHSGPQWIGGAGIPMTTTSLGLGNAPQFVTGLSLGLKGE